MCVEVSNNYVNSSLEASSATSMKKLSYSVKKLLKQLFKQQHKCRSANHSDVVVNAESITSLESVENLHNASLECMSLESHENEANECRDQQGFGELEDYDFAAVSAHVPVHFVRTKYGTFFWTADADLPADNDLIEPLQCCTSNTIAMPQQQDRWAQA